MWGKSCMEYGNAPRFRNVSLLFNLVNQRLQLGTLTNRCILHVKELVIATEVTRATKSWYDELYKPGYNFNNPGWNENPGAGHFTQLVWKGTTELGIGIAKAGFHIFQVMNTICYLFSMRFYENHNKQGSNYYVVGRYRSGTVPLLGCLITTSGHQSFSAFRLEALVNK